MFLFLFLLFFTFLPHIAPLQTNTFQCILATDHSSSFVIFLYKEGGIQWAAGESTRAIDTEGIKSHGI